MITQEEMKIVSMLADVWNRFCKLSKQHEMEQSEFCTAIHQCQNMVLIRPTVRDNNLLQESPR